MVKPGRGNSVNVPISFNFQYFSIFFNQLTIFTNGFIRFNYYDFIRSQTYYSYAIAMAYDLDTTSSGFITYQNIYPQSNDFNGVKSDLNRFSSSFTPTNVFRIMFTKVPLFTSAASPPTASFQIILASDSSSSSLLLLRYASCFSSSIFQIYSPTLYYNDYNGAQQNIAIGTGSNMCTSSNVNSVGLWVFNVTSIVGQVTPALKIAG